MNTTKLKKTKHLGSMPPHLSPQNLAEQRTIKAHITPAMVTIEKANASIPKVLSTLSISDGVIIVLRMLCVTSAFAMFVV